MGVFHSIIELDLKLSRPLSGNSTRLLRHVPSTRQYPIQGPLRPIAMDLDEESIQAPPDAAYNSHDEANSTLKEHGIRYGYGFRISKSYLLRTAGSSGCTHAVLMPTPTADGQRLKGKYVVFVLGCK